MCLLVYSTSIYGHLGENISLSCRHGETGHNYIEWSCPTKKGDPIIVSKVRGYTVHIHVAYEGRLEMDFDTGNLVIMQLSLSDERRYTCKYGSGISTIATKRAAEYQLNIYGNVYIIFPHLA